MNIIKFRHGLIFFYIAALFLNININTFFNINLDFRILKLAINEIILADIFILIFSIYFIKQIFLEIKEFFKNALFKKLLYLILIGIIGIILSIINSQVDKQINLVFIVLFYLNIFKYLIGFIIFKILVDKFRPEIDEKLIIYFTLILISGIIINYFQNPFYLRLYYPFTKHTYGYNLLGLLSGVAFVTFYNYLKEKRSNIISICTILAFIIAFFTFSKSTILALVIIFLFYEVILIKVKKKNLFISIIILSILILGSDIIKYYFHQNSLSVIDIILNPIFWFESYGSLYYRIEHVWLSEFDKNLNIITFLFGEGIYSPKTHDSLYFTIISRFGFLGLSMFFIISLELFKIFGKKKHNVISFILVFGLTSEMMIQSNIINPLIMIITYLNYKKLENPSLK